MKTGRDIDSIYRDRLKGANMPPPQDAWENILSRLPENEEKKNLFPLWIKWAGVAATLALLITIFALSNQSASEEVTISSTSGTLNSSIPEVSTTFNEVMQESSILLQALILRSGEMKLQEKHYISAASVEEEVKKITNPSEVSEPFREAQVYKLDASETVLAEGNLSEEMASSNKIAEASPVPEKNEPAGLAPEKDEAEGKFRLSTRIAPVFFNNFGKGNAVETSFSQKAATGEVTFSYGVNVAYEVSEKVNIRSGINKVDLAYNTREVSFYDIAGTKSFGPELSETTTLASPPNGTLNHEMGFFEVPLEVEYVILDKRFAVGLIGGGSALFLEQNHVSLETPDNTTDLGDTNNMEKLSFTTNLGVSMGYDVTGQLQFNLEPVVKLQMNTFKNNENSNPYFLGIYSGFSYRF